MINLTDKIKDRILQLPDLQHDPNTQSRFAGYWVLLKQNEQFLLDYINHIPNPKGNIVLANMLYVLNNEIDKELTAILKLFSLPDSAISRTTMESFLKSDEIIAGHVEPDGILCQDKPFAGLDPNWIELFLSYIWYQEFPQQYAVFASTPHVFTAHEESTLSIAVFGDWGTGDYDDNGYPSPSSLVGGAIRDLKPDISVHLGDVYYAGTSAQFETRLINNFPSGRLASYTMNGNHEMFDGANAYFKTALSHPVFEKQHHTSYFAVRYNNFVIIGLDTAYYDKSPFHLTGTLTDNKQIEFIRSLQITPEQKIILFTHHNAMTLDGTQINEPLFSQIFHALGNRYPDYWYYGHIHNGVIYNNAAKQGEFICTSGLSPQIRCFGHASIPIGKACSLTDEQGGMKKGIDYFAATPLPNPNNNLSLSRRVKNGFMMITLDGSQFSEHVYEVSDGEAAKCVWTNEKL